MMLPDIDEAACDVAATSPAGRVVALVWSHGRPQDWLDTVVSLGQADGLDGIVFNGKQVPAAPTRCAISRTTEHSMDSALAGLFAQGCRAVLVVLSPIAMVRAGLSNALRWLTEDRSLATVSFLSNDAGHLSFPYRNTPVPVCPEGYGPESLTERLRQGMEDAQGTTILLPEGPAVLVSQQGYWTVGGLQESHGLPTDAAVKDFGLRAGQMGLRNILDSTSYVLAPWEWGERQGTALMHEATRGWLRGRHGTALDRRYDEERTSLVAPIARALDDARARALGVRVLIDGSCLGPQEMGTQNATIGLARHLAQDDRVRAVYLAVPNPNSLPAYVQLLQAVGKVHFTAAGALDFPDAPSVDIIHRPYQPDIGIPWQRWRQIARRTVITIQDLIAYRNGAYFPSYAAWQRYRASLAMGCKHADAVVTISTDVIRSIQDERLEVAERRLAMIACGTSFSFRETVNISAPAAITARGWERERLVLILGANYAHKNRDLGIRVWQTMKRMGVASKLVLAGAAVPWGSTREGEAIPAACDPDVLRLADVPAGERDWLMANATLVIYLTSAEGFGFLPFEAGAFGVPTLHVAFGPFQEMIDDPNLPEAWDVTALAARGKLLMEDKDAAADAVGRVMQKTVELSWTNNATRHVDRYLLALRQPANQQ